MNVVILSSLLAARGAVKLQKEFVSRGHVCVLLHPDMLNTVLFHPDVVISRFSALSFENTARALDVFQLSHPDTLVTPSAEAIRISFDKLLTSVRLAECGIPTPVTWHGGNPVRVSLPAVVKPRSGSRGEGIYLATTHAQLEVALGQFSTIAQEYIKEAKGVDIRAFVIHDKMVVAMRRIAPEGDFISNIANGGSAEPITLDKQTRQVAVEACRALGLFYGGVDLIESKKGYLVLEANSSPGFKIGDVTGVDVIAELVRSIELDFKKGNKWSR